MNGQAVAARMFWVGLDVVRQEVCRGLDGCIWYGKMGFGSTGSAWLGRVSRD
jgi:hypothetical protein